MYVIFEKESTVILGGPLKKYKSLGAAKSALTRAEKKGLISNKEDYAILSLLEFKKVEKMVERVNIMSGEKFMESVNTPYYCSPSSETYWSM